MPSLGLGDSWDSVSEMHTPETVRLLVKGMVEDVGPIRTYPWYLKHPTYHRLVAMGMPVVPTLLKLLQEHPHALFPILLTITGENPISEPDRGRVANMVETWREWGRARGLA